jgi:photosystem II stability/assembly factor-like uncharacterized protein
MQTKIKKRNMHGRRFPMRYHRNTKSLILAAMLPATLFASWEKLNMPTDEGFGDIWAINEQTIFVDGDAGLWKTFDGSNWTLDTVIPFFEYVYFVNDTLGFIGYNHFTTDGGKTWHKVDGTFPGWNVDFPPGQSFLGYGGYSLSGDLDYPRCHLYRTIDGGWHWDTLPALPEVYPDSKEDINLGGLSFPTTDTGYVTASCLKRTSDSTVEQHLSYFKTTDGGQTWTLNEEGLYNDDFNPRLIAFPQNASVGYVAGGGGKVFKTTNGGATWDTVLKDRPPIVSMCFPENDKVGYVFGDSVANRTQDGGKTWQKAIITHDSSFYASHFINNSVGFITGYKYMPLLMKPFDPGYVLKTTDGLLGIAEEDWVDVKPELLELSAPALFSNELKMDYSSKASGQLRASVYDAAGRQVRSLDWHAASGQGTLTLPCSNIASGVYFVRVEICTFEGKETRTLRAVKIR